MFLVDPILKSILSSEFISALLDVVFLLKYTSKTDNAINTIFKRERSIKHFINLNQMIKDVNKNQK